MLFTPTPWSDALEHGVLWMDHQHRALVELNAQLFRDYKAGNTDGRMDATLAELHHYIRSHFGLEEAYMREYGYPETDAHRKQHREFVEELEEFVRDTEELGDETGALSIPTLCVEIDRWIIEHIRETDGALARFIREREAGELRAAG